MVFMKANFFKKIFYPPNYLFLPAVGLEICNGSIKYIEFNHKNGLFSVKKFGQTFLLADTIKGGSVLNKNNLVKALGEMKSKISSDFVKVSIPEEKTYIFDVKLPKEAKDNLREALEFKIEENVPLKLEDCFFEFEIIEEKEASDHLVVNVYVVPRKVVLDYTESLIQAGIYPVAFEIESKVIANTLIPITDNKRNFIILEIKEDSTVLIAVVNGFVRRTSVVTIGENDIRKALLKSGLFSDELISGKYFENDFSFETIYSKESYPYLINIFSILKDETENFNEYVNTKILGNESDSSDKDIILCGRASLLPGLAKHINQNIKTRVTNANIFSNIPGVEGYTSKIKFNDSLDFATPVGLAISSYK